MTKCDYCGREYDTTDTYSDFVPVDYVDGTMDIFFACPVCQIKLQTLGDCDHAPSDELRVGMALMADEWPDEEEEA